MVIYFIGVYACTQYAKQVNEVDPPSAVMDEVLGMGIAMLGIPKQLPFIIMAFILFDSLIFGNPFPIRKIEKLSGGWGIMTDDLVAGIYARAWIGIGYWAVQQLH